MLRKSLFAFVAVLAMSLSVVNVQPASAASTLSGAASPLKIDIGKTALLKGRLSSGANRVKVYIERGRNGGWYPYSSATTANGGYWSATVKPTSSGRYAFRARIGSLSSPTFYLSVYKLTYLSDIDALSSNQAYRDVVKINGATYYDSIYIWASCNVDDYTEYDLGRRGRTLTVVIGALDDANSGIQGPWRILGDGAVIAQGTAKLGVAPKYVLDVTNVLRLRIEVRKGVSPSCGQGDVGFGDALLRS
ncbi:MAG: serine/threonine protein kinase [Acidimicrobiales bacterium]|nr:serine/threonine protein kinase [Acidimicrobiales bacterium]